MTKAVILATRWIFPLSDIDPCWLFLPNTQANHVLGIFDSLPDYLLLSEKPLLFTSFLLNWGGAELPIGLNPYFQLFLLSAGRTSYGIGKGHFTLDGPLSTGRDEAEEYLWETEFQEDLWIHKATFSHDPNIEELLTSSTDTYTLR